MTTAAHIVPSILNRASGPSYSVVQLCRALMGQGCATSLFVLDGVPPDFPPEIPVRTFARWRYPNRLGVSPSMRDALGGAAGSFDVIHNHSLWMMPNVYAGPAARKGKARLIISPRGTLSAWALDHSRWVKRLVWWMGQRAVLKQADGFHATAESEFEDIRRAGFDQPVAILPNGIDIPPLAFSRGGADRTLLYVGRLHPKKGLPSLVSGWARVQSLYPEWRLDIIGRDEGGHERELKKQAAAAGCRRIRFLGPVYGDALIRAYQEADLYVLPTHSENFGMTVAEALANGTPVITTKGAPWEGVLETGCGWWPDIGESPLTETLRQALGTPREKLGEMGQAGRQWMIREYAWPVIAERMILYYKWMGGEGTMPSFVRTGPLNA